MASKSSVISGIFLILFIVFLAAAGYIFYITVAGEPRSYNILGISENDNVIYSETEQFYENLRYRESRISYQLSPACDDEKTEDVEEAFSILEENTILEFYEKTNGEIKIFCSELAPETDNKKTFVAGEGGPTEIINTSLYGVIFEGKVSFFRPDNCDNPNVALHEILHSLGFDHNDNPKSILYPTLDCSQTVDDSIYESINSLYSVETISELRITEVSASKSGVDLDFEIIVMNQGLESAENVKLSLYADERHIDDFNLDSIDIGIRKTLEVMNLKVLRSAKVLRFVVDEDNEITEIYEANNEAILSLES